MDGRSRAVGMMGAVCLTVGLLPGTTASAAVEASCVLPVGSVTAGGDHRAQTVVATLPPTTTGGGITADVYPAGLARVSASMAVMDDGYGGAGVGGYVVLGDAMYTSGYHTDANGQIENKGLTRLGGGWGGFVALEESEYQGPTDPGVSRVNTYGLRSDGVLFRWTVDSKGVWRNRVSYPGFAAVKSMALIAKAPPSSPTPAAERYTPSISRRRRR